MIKNNSLLTPYNIIKYLILKKTITNNYIQSKYNNYQNFVKITRNNLLEKQFGGGKDEAEFIVKYDNNKYYFYKDDIDDNFFVLYSIDKIKSRCVVLEIDLENKTANIQDIKGFNNCVHNKNNIGSTLLQITLKLLIKLNLSDKYKINKIILSDDSYKYCPAIKENIDLKTMCILLTGHTWYGKYGFRPVKYKSNKLIIDDSLNDKYENNLKIMNNITISDINLLKYFKKLEYDKINAINQIIKKHPEMLIKDFLSKFLKNFDSNCKLFSNFYSKLFDDFGLKFTGTFYGFWIK